MHNRFKGLIGYGLPAPDPGQCSPYERDRSGSLLHILGAGYHHEEQDGESAGCHGRQPQYAPLSVFEQIAALVAVNRGVFDELDPKEVAEAERMVGKTVKEELSDLCDRIERGEELAEEDMQTLFTTAQRAAVGLRKQEKQHANDRGLEEKDREHPGSPVSSEDHEGAGSGEHPPV